MKTGFPCENVNSENPVLIIGNGFAVHLQILQEHLETESPWNISTVTIWSLILSNIFDEMKGIETILNGYFWLKIFIVNQESLQIFNATCAIKCNRKLLLGQNSVRFLCQ